MQIVALHGINNTPAAFDGLRRALAPDVAVQAPALPALADVDAIASALLPALPDRFVLAGHSFGGYVALALLALAPGRIAGLSMINSQDGPDSPEMAEARHRMADAADAGKYAELAAAAAARSFHPTHLARPEIRALREAEIAGYGALRYAAHQRACAIRPDRRALLAAYGGVKLVIAADEDAVIPTARQTEMARAVGARLAVVPDTGHMLPVEAPEALAALLRDCVGAA